MKNIITEGEWKSETVQPQSNSDNTFRILKPITGVIALGKIVALCGDTTKAEVQANTRLITAAPELMEACYAFLFSTQYESLSVYFNNEQKHAIKLMQKAVKKAML